MKTVYLDALKLCKREEAHCYLQEQLGLPGYYGKNLDALYDCLTEMGGLNLILEQSDAAGGYFPAVLAVLKDAAGEREDIKLQRAEEAGRTAQKAARERS